MCIRDRYNEARLTELLESKEAHKQNEYSQNLKIKEVEQLIRDEEHKVEIVKGEIHLAKENGLGKRTAIADTKTSRNCPTCGEPLKAQHQEHIDKIIKKLEDEMFALADEITAKQKMIDNVHTPNLGVHRQNIDFINQDKEKQSLEMESILVEIGELTNDKNEVENRKEQQIELDQIPIKIQNEELKKAILQDNLKQYENSLLRIEENVKIEKGITAAKEKLVVLGEEKTGYDQSVTLKKSEITQHESKIKENTQLITDFEAQQYQDEIIDAYKKCVHRDGLPRQLLSNHIIPKINVELENVLSVAPFKVWLDVDDLRPKLAYYNTPTAIIDAISSCGKERTFSSISLKTALNEINVKSKPTMFLLDEVMGKLDNYGSVEEFVIVLQMIKERYKKVLIVEQNHEMNPDYLINVSITDGGISSAIIE